MKIEYLGFLPITFLIIYLLGLTEDIAGSISFNFEAALVRLFGIILSLVTVIGFIWGLNAYLNNMETKKQQKKQYAGFGRHEGLSEKKSPLTSLIKEAKKDYDKKFTVACSGSKGGRATINKTIQIKSFLEQQIRKTWKAARREKK